MNEKEKQLVDAIAALCQELGWTIAVPYAEDDNDRIDGLLIGTEEYISSILQQLDEMVELEYEDNEDSLLDSLSLKKGNKETVH